jgi:small subunit ribosomal protein S6
MIRQKKVSKEFEKRCWPEKGISSSPAKLPATGEKMQRAYEVMFIVRPDVLEEDMDKLIATLQGHATTAGAVLQNTEKMGRRRLAYDVKKFQDGKAIHELERRMRVAEQVIKYITVRTDEEQQRLDKVRKLRASRTKRPPAEQAAQENEGSAVTA